MTGVEVTQGSPFAGTAHAGCDRRAKGWKCWRRLAGFPRCTGEGGFQTRPYSAALRGVGSHQGSHPHPPYRVRGKLRAGFRLFGKSPSTLSRRETGLRAGFALSRRGRGGRAFTLPLPVEGEGVRASRSLFSCVAGSRSPGGRAAGVCGVDGRAIGVRLVPVLFESFLDSALGGGELHGCGFFVLFLLDALGPQGLSVLGGPGGSFAASLCSGASPWGPSYSVLGSFGGLGVGLAGPGMGSRLRGNDD